MRVVDEDGRIPIWLPATPVQFDVRHAYALEARGMPAPQSSGTVKRVGLDQVWTRM
jgi:hypothetical protein